MDNTMLLPRKKTTCSSSL